MVVALGLYAATAAINGLHSNWVFGFCFPARFLITTLPVLVLGLAWGLPLLLRTGTTAFFAVLALAISIEGVLDTLLLPESGYEGENLLNRSLNHFYPLHQHFFLPDQEEMPLLDIGFWALLLVALSFRNGIGLGRSGLIRVGLVLAAALAPFLWSRSDALAARLPSSQSPYMTPLSTEGTAGAMALRKFDIPITINAVAEAAQPDGSILARPGVTSAGIVSFSRIPIPTGASLEIYKMTFPGLRVEPPDGQVSGHIVLTRGYTIPAVSYSGVTAPAIHSSAAMSMGTSCSNSESIKLVFNVSSVSIRDMANWRWMGSKPLSRHPRPNRVQ